MVAPLAIHYFYPDGHSPLNETETAIDSPTAIQSPHIVCPWYLANPSSPGRHPRIWVNASQPGFTWGSSQGTWNNTEGCRPWEFYLIDLQSSWASRVLKALLMILMLRIPGPGKGSINFDIEKSSWNMSGISYYFPSRVVTTGVMWDSVR